MARQEIKNNNGTVIYKVKNLVVNGQVIVSAFKKNYS